MLTEAVGLAAAIWPHAWLGLFGHDPRMLETGAAYLRMVGPAYGFFGLGLSLYFASQGAGRLFWPLFAGLLRLVIAIGGGWLALRLTGSLTLGVRRAERWRWSPTAARCWPPSHRGCGSASAAEIIGQGQRIVWFGTTLPALVSRSAT